MKDLVGLTTAITDILVNVSDNDLSYYKLNKGFTSFPLSPDFEDFIGMTNKRHQKAFTGGSPANVIFNAAKLGLETALLGSLGNDSNGREYLYELKRGNIEDIMPIVPGRSGIIYILVTPDGERTPVQIPGVSGEFTYNINDIPKSKVFHTSGYELTANPNKTIDTIVHAYQNGAEISFDLANPSIVKMHRAEIDKILELTYILFMTEEESEAISPNIESAMDNISKICCIVALKRGKNGSIVRQGNVQYDIPVIPVKVANTNGAGDAYAAGFLAAYIKGYDLKTCGNHGSLIASQVCSIDASHL